jgi:hypothetical protein
MSLPSTSQLAGLIPKTLSVSNTTERQPMLGEE